MRAIVSLFSIISTVLLIVAYFHAWTDEWAEWDKYNQLFIINVWIDIRCYMYLYKSNENRSS